MSRFVILATALVFFVYGLGFALVPQPMSVAVTGDFPRTESGLIDMRSTYGGLSIAIGVLLWGLSRTPGLQLLGLRAVALMMGAMAATRTIGIVVEGSPNPVMWAFLSAEILMLSLSLRQLRALSRSGANSNIPAA